MAARSQSSMTNILNKVQEAAEAKSKAKLYEDQFEEFREDTQMLSRSESRGTLWEQGWDDEDVVEDFLDKLREKLDAFSK